VAKLNNSPFRVRSNVKPTVRVLLGLVPFLLVIIGYTWISHERHKENPKDKLAPNWSQFVSGAESVWERRVSGFTETEVREGETAEDVSLRISGSIDFADRIKADPPVEDWETGEIRDLIPGETVRAAETQRRIIVDTLSSLQRLGLGLGGAVLLAVTIGLLGGSYTYIGAFVRLIVTGLAKIPPLAILPIIFILAGAGESSKIAIIIIGVAPTMTLDVMQRVLEVPRQLIVKAYTLGADSFEIVVDVIRPIVWPHVINSLRLALGPAWVFLIAAEAISAQSGLGYRIFVVQRQLGMNVILMYVVWIMMLGILLDYLLASWLRWRYPWTEAKK